MAKARTSKRTTEKRDVYQDVTDSIVAALDTCGPMSRPWVSTNTSTARPRSISGRRYRGMNVVILWAEAIDKGYEHGVWGTYNAWGKVDAQVRKGEKGTLVTLWKAFDGKPSADEIADGADPKSTVKRLVLRHFHVWNVAQVDGYTVAEPTHDGPEAIEHAEAFFAAVGANVQHLAGSERACYSRVADVISMEAFRNFTSAATYYSVLAHEHGHWTGHKSRLDRDKTLGGKLAAGTESYAFEELVAELTAAFVGAHLGILTAVRDDHAAYLKSWVAALRNDKRYIFTASAAAQKACDYLLEAAGELPAVEGDDADEGAPTELVAA